MRALAAMVALAAAGCGGGDSLPACVTVDPTCTPQLYLPTFDNVYTMTLQNSCGSQRSSCHAADGAAHLSMATETEAYVNLLAGRVTAGDPSCSELIVRVTSVGASYQMPQGPASSALTAGEQCSLIHWVAAGAPGPTGDAGVTREDAP